MKGDFLAKKPKPKYISTWDVGSVINYLKSLYPFENLDIKSLTFKNSFIESINNSTEGLVSLKINQMADHGKYAVFTVYDLKNFKTRS